MIVELLRNRFSLRAFQDKPVPADVLHDILEVGRLSPSGGNEQPWVFGVITDGELIKRIAEIAYQQNWIARARLLIVLCTVGVSDQRGGRDIQKDRYPAYSAAIGQMDQGLYWALNQEEHQTKIAGTHMVLVAVEHGIGSCLASLLDLPEGYLPCEVLVFGYPAAKGQPSARKSLDEVVFYNTYNRH